VARSTAWSPAAIAREAYQSEGEARAAIRRAAEAAVRHWTKQYRTIALDLSGGLDSSILLGLLTRYGGQAETVAVNYVTDGEEGDERRYARAAAALHGVRVLDQVISVEAASDLAAAGDRLLRPSVRALSAGYDRLGGQILRSLSADAFATGTGGDHLFYDHLGADAAADYLHLHGPTVGVVRTAHQLAQISRSTIWDGLGAAAASAFGIAPNRRSLLFTANPFAADAVVASAAFDRFAHPWLASAIGKVPPAKLRQILNLCELQRHYWRYGRADVADELHPLVSEPLITACLKTPAYMFGAGGVQRGLARQAFADLLPRSVLERRTKGGNTRLWVQVMLRHLPLLKELLLEGKLASAGYLNRALLEKTLQPTALTTNPDFAPLVNCITAEMWLQEWVVGPPAQRAAVHRKKSLAPR
jgi:asparagine synthase (glutamine-hydrolysing)